MKLRFPVQHPILKTIAAIFILAMSARAQEAGVLLENRALRAELNLSSGAITLLDKQTGVSWELGAPEAMFNTGRVGALPPLRVIHRDRRTLHYRRDGIGEFALSLLADPPRVDYSAVPEGEVKELRLLSKALPVGRRDIAVVLVVRRALNNPCGRINYENDPENASRTKPLHKALSTIPRALSGSTSISPGILGLCVLFSF